MSNKNLKRAIFILSIIISLLIVLIIDIARIVTYENLIINVAIHLIVLAGITQGIYFGAISVAILMTKISLRRNARALDKMRREKLKSKGVIKNEN